MKIIKLLKFLIPLFSFLIVSACASTPKPEKYYADRGDVFALLAPGADLYISADVAGARPILEGLSLGNMGGAELSDFLDMSDSLAAAVYSKDTSRHFLAAAWGNYPSARGGLFFSTSSDWVRAKSVSGIEYWHSSKSGLSVFLNAARAFVSDGDPFVPPPGAESPPALAPLRKEAVLSGWIEKPGYPLSRITAALGVPVEVPAEQLIFAVYPAQGSASAGRKTPAASYTAVLRFETANSSRAGALVRLFSLAKVALAFADLSARPDLQTLARAFFAETPEQDGSAMVVRTGILEGKELALLFNTLSVYSSNADL